MPRATPPGDPDAVQHQHDPDAVVQRPLQDGERRVGMALLPTRQAKEHPLQNGLCRAVILESLVRVQGDFLAGRGADPAIPQKHVAVLHAMPDRFASGVVTVTVLRSSELDHFVLHEFLQHAQAHLNRQVAARKGLKSDLSRSLPVISTRWRPGPPR